MDFLNQVTSVIALLPGNWADYLFMQYALLALLMLTPIFAILGCLVVNHKMAFYADAMGHSTLTGIAIGAIFGLQDPTLPMLALAVAMAGVITYLRHYSASPPDTVISLVMAAAVALGLMILARGGGFAKYSGYLVGDILTLAPGDLGALALVVGAVGVFCLFFFNRLLFIGLSPILAHSRGGHVFFQSALFSIVVALVVTMSIRWLGLLVINSILIIPAAAAGNLAKNTAHYVLYAVAISLFSGIAGLISSFYLNTTAGAAIVIWAIIVYLGSAAFRCRATDGGTR